MKKTKEIWEFGDFQTPDKLALQVTSVLQNLNIDAESIIEPTCGKGSLLITVAKSYPRAQRYFGADINGNYLNELRSSLRREELDTDIELMHTDFFDTNWNQILADTPEPILIIGNPPWVTSSELSALQSSNVPDKSNFQGRTGMDALTGKSNFDISEWMLLQYLKWLEDKDGTIAVLCKTLVARRILAHLWKHNIKSVFAHIYKIDAKMHFNASVDACLFVVRLGGGRILDECNIYEHINAKANFTKIGYRNNSVLSDVVSYDLYSHIISDERNYIWRSGLKHDCSKVMELTRNEHSYINGNNDIVSLEDDFIYPLLKSSDIANGKIYERRKYVVVTQKYVGEDTNTIKQVAPMTWHYLESNKDFFANRASSIYKNRPIYSIFGIGDYSFAPWKIAISGFYKRLNFVLVPPIDDKPVMFDDTVYFLPCSSEKEGLFILKLLNSDLAAKVLNALIFWEDKRPITIDVLKRINLQALAYELEVEEAFLDLVKFRGLPSYTTQTTQLKMFEKRPAYQ